ncbi:MAG: hypothetical protein EXR72_14815 [Myxococcales bacterium]|nr:hypothetical protein [Myxococcales bacterium]
MIPIAIPTGEGFDLEGLLDGEGRRGVVICHPHPAFGGTLHTPLVAALAGALAGAGLRVLRFNFRGIGRSGGTASGGRVEERDVAAACAFLGAGGASEIAIAGYSFGALMAAKAIGRALVLPSRYLALGFPTTIIGDHADRIAEVTRALAAVPSLLVSGTADQFSEIGRLREWTAGRPDARLVALPDQGHFFTGPALSSLIERSLEFLTAGSA